jgi:hypothetical protein
MVLDVGVWFRVLVMNELMVVVVMYELMACYVMNLNLIAMVVIFMFNLCHSSLIT